MCDQLPVPTMTRRHFNACCLFGLCGVAAATTGLHRLAGNGVALRAHAKPADLGKWSKEALFYQATPTGVKCLKCPHGCHLAPDQIGFCRSRVNHRGKLYSLAYGNPCAVHVDPIEKKPFFHFLPQTRAFSIAAAGCNMRCLNCQNWQISQVSPQQTVNYDLMPEAVVAQCSATACESIAYTYSEPTTFYEYALDTARLARAQGIKNVLKSNGYINEEPLRLLCQYLDAANIDLKCFDEATYLRLSRGHLAPVLRTLQVLHEQGVWLEITNLVIPSWTDNPAMIQEMCRWLVKNGLQCYPLHFTRFMPLYQLTQLPVTPVAALEQARALALEAGMQYVYVGNVPGHEAENTLCHQCGKLLIARRGFTLLENHLLQGRCEFCGANIPGRWH